MTSTTETSSAPTPTTWAAVRTGIGVGVAGIAVYLVAGFVVAGWSFREFVGRLTPSIVVWLALAGGTVVTVVAVPVVASLRYRVFSPLLVLSVAVVGWTGLGLVQGIPLQDLFGLSYYALALSPVYLLCYLVFGGLEYWLRG